jgi:hypothetical protein
VGILICAFAGGYLFDHWNKFAPFNLFGCFSVLGVILCFMVWNKYKGRFEEFEDETI